MEGPAAGGREAHSRAVSTRPRAEGAARGGAAAPISLDRDRAGDALQSHPERARVFPGAMAGKEGALEYWTLSLGAGEATGRAGEGGGARERAGGSDRSAP